MLKGTKDTLLIEGADLSVAIARMKELGFKLENAYAINATDREISVDRQYAYETILLALLHEKINRDMLPKLSEDKIAESRPRKLNKYW